MTRPARDLLKTALLACVLAAAGCDDELPPAGVYCGNTSCQPGQVCCLDCDGRGLCAAPGTPCPGTACGDAGAPGDGAVDGTVPDGGRTVPCGDTRCFQGQICCLDCDGRGSCGTPGTACSGVACGIDGGSGFPCGQQTCEPGQTCCSSCPGPAYYCGPQGSYCPLVESCPTCGALEQPCCKERSDNPCDPDLKCCSGVPYPTEGVCAKECTAISDRRLKRGIQAVDPQQVLERLATLPITRWHYRDDPRAAPHIGPMAQDFRAAFGLGCAAGPVQTIDLIDANGVTMAAVQALHRELRALRAEVARLRAERAAPPPRR